MRVYVSNTADSLEPTPTVESFVDLSEKSFAQRALWLGVMPVGISTTKGSLEPESIGLYYHSIRKGKFPVSHEIHNFRAQILRTRDKDEPFFGYEPALTPGGRMAIMKATVAVNFLKAALPNAQEVVVTRPTEIYLGVKDMRMSEEYIERAVGLSDQASNDPADFRAWVEEIELDF